MFQLYLKKSTIYIAISTLIFCLIILFILNNFIIHLQEEEKTHLLQSTADIINLRIQKSLESRFSLVDALAATYQTHPQMNEETFIEIAKAFIVENLPIRALQISDKETYVKYMYPIKTNKTIYKKPIKLIDDSLRGKWVKQTISTKDKSIQPPFTLRQGGIGTIVRKAVFIDSTFIGLAIGVINLSDILDESISKAEFKRFNINLSDENYNYFFQNRTILDSNFVSRKINFPGTVWNLQLSEHSSNQYSKNIPIILLWTIGIIIILLFLLFEIIILNYNEQLKVSIKKKTDELKESQKKINKIENLKSLGRLAGGIAHNFNNQLNSIIGFSELIKDDINDSNNVKRYTQKILTSSKKSAELVSRISSFSRQGKFNENEIDLHSVLTLITNKYSLYNNIKFILNLRAKDYILFGDYSEINNAINNIIQNSIEAIIDEGAIIIRTENILLDNENKIVIEEKLQPGNFIYVHIEDTGKGIKKEDLLHVFDPFYTSKDIALGAGMGLSSSYGTILEHDGYIEIDSELGKWTAIKIYLPVSQNLMSN